MTVKVVSKEEFREFFSQVANASTSVVLNMSKYLDSCDPTLLCKAASVVCSAYLARDLKVEDEKMRRSTLEAGLARWLDVIDSECKHHTGICTLEDLDIYCLMCLKHFPLK